MLKWEVSLIFQQVVYILCVLDGVCSTKYWK